MEINILGQDWTIETSNKNDCEKLETSDGVCDYSIKKITLDSFEDAKVHPMAQENFSVFEQKTLRHEIIHAFLLESGLGNCSEWAENEEMVDWFARQFPKILKAFQDAKCL